MSTPRIVIVGAGAAGVGAGLELAERGIPFVILEAADRMGGRAFTDTTSLPYQWDQGCHWFHCADQNPLVPWAEKLGIGYVRETYEGAFATYSGGRWLSKEEDDAGEKIIDAAFDAIYEATEKGLDVPIPDVLPPASQWSPIIRSLIQLLASEDPEKISAASYGDYEDTENDWPVTGGYGTLIKAMAANLPIRLGTPVTAIEERTTGARVETADGAMDVDAVIVTASTNAILKGAIRFGAGPARDLTEAMAGFPCGSYEKIAIALDRPLIADKTRRFCYVDASDGSLPLEFFLSPTGLPFVIAQVGGSHARELRHAGEAAMIDFAYAKIEEGFGTAALDTIIGTAVTNWEGTPYIHGAYSNAKVGHWKAHHAAIRDNTGRVRFAGEAMSLHASSTAHGAYQTGRAAAADLALMIDT